jgi:hypothetical protein
MISDPSVSTSNIIHHDTQLASFILPRVPQQACQSSHEIILKGLFLQTLMQVNLTSSTVIGKQEQATESKIQVRL